MKKSVILLVDDDDVTIFLTQRLLSRLTPNAEIKVAHNGEEALKIIDEIDAVNHRCPDLILLDINMPVMNGLEFMDKFSHSTIRPHCRIVAVTTSSNKNDFNALKGYGVDDIVLKPVTQSSISDILSVV